MNITFVDLILIFLILSVGYYFGYKWKSRGLIQFLPVCIAGICIVPILRPIQSTGTTELMAFIIIAIALSFAGFFLFHAAALMNKLMS